MAEDNEIFDDLNKSQDKFAKNFIDSLNVIREAITTMGDRLNDTLKNAINQNNNLEDSTRRVARLYTNDITKGLDKITSSLDEQSYLTVKISRGDGISKELIKEKEKVEKEILKIQKRINSLSGEGIELSAQDKENIETKIKDSRLFLKLLESENKERIKSLGITGRVLEGVDEVVRKLGGNKLADILNIEEAIKKTRELNNATPLSSFGKLSNITKNIGSNLISGLKGIDPLTIIIGQLVEAIIHSDKAIGEIAKSLGFSYNQASKLKDKLTSIASTTGDVFVTTENLQKTFLGVNEALGTTIEINKEDLKIMTQLAERAGIQSEVLNDIFKLSKLTNKSYESITEEIYGQIAASSKQTGISVNYKKVLGEVGKTSAVIQLSLKNSVSNIADAVVQAKALGSSLEQIDKIAGSLLDFESSISSEIEAELLVGRQLNLERARYAALTNDISTLSKEIKENIGSSAEFGNLNRIAQESIAKSMGLTREELADILKQQDLLANTDYNSINEAQKEFNKLIEQGYNIEEAKAKIGNKTLADQLASVTMQEEFNQTLSKLKEIFVSIAKPIISLLKPIMDILSPILGALTDIVQLALIPLTESIKVIVDVTKEIFSPLIEAGKEIFGIFSDIFGIKGDSIFGSLGGLLREISNIFYKGLFYPAKVIGSSFIKLLVTPVKSFYGIIGGIVDIFQGDFTEGIKQIGTSITKFIVSPFQFFLDLVVGGINGVIKTINFFGGSIKELKDIKIVDEENEKKPTIKGDDVLSPGYGKRTLLTPEGKIKLNNKDAILAGTQLDRSIKETNEKIPQTIQEISNDTINNVVNRNITQNINNNRTNNQTISNKTTNNEVETTNNNEEIIKQFKVLQKLLSENNSLLSKLLNKEGVVNLDGSKVGEFLISGANSFSI